MTILQMQDFTDRGKLSSLKLVEFYLERIEKLDRSGPVLNSVLALNPQAREIARALDEERITKGKRSLLHGIPLLIKGNIDTGDLMETSAGSLALKGNRAQQDAFIVSRLRDAGAVILGKTNLSEWANFRSTRSSSGWSSAGGQTKNPYVLDRSPCGSSSGSAVAVSANLCAAAVGTETDGSIVCPAHMNGIVGIKPTLGLVSRTGIIPIAHSQDTAGPMTRTVTDGAILLEVLAGYDPGDPITRTDGRFKEKTFMDLLDKNALKGARMGAARNYFGFHEKVDALMDEAIELMRKHGAVIVDPADIDNKDKYDDEEFEVLLYEFKDGINRYLSASRGKVKSLSELILYNKKEEKRIMPFFGQEILEKALLKGPLTDPAYLEALNKCRNLSREQGLDRTLKKYALDAVIAPTGGPAWKIDLINGDHFTAGSSQPAAVSGYPGVTVPAGFVAGLPVGITFMGGAFCEPKLIGLAYAFEQLRRARREPGFRASD